MAWFIMNIILIFFFFFAKLHCHSYEKEDTTTWKSTTQVERITLGRFSLLKHKSNVEFKASFAALCVAKLQDLWTQTKEQLRETDTEFRIFPVFVPLHSKVFWYNLKIIHNLLSVTHLKYMLSTTPFSFSSFLFFFFFYWV